MCSFVVNMDFTISIGKIIWKYPGIRNKNSVKEGMKSEWVPQNRQKRNFVFTYVKKNRKYNTGWKAKGILTRVSNFVLKVSMLKKYTGVFSVPFPWFYLVSHPAWLSLVWEFLAGTDLVDKACQNVPSSTTCVGNRNIWAYFSKSLLLIIILYSSLYSRF